MLEVFFSWHPSYEGDFGEVILTITGNAEWCTQFERVTVAFCWMSIFNLWDRHLLNDCFKCILSLSFMYLEYFTKLSNHLTAEVFIH